MFCGDDVLRKKVLSHFGARWATVRPTEELLRGRLQVGQATKATSTAHMPPAGWLPIQAQSTLPRIRNNASTDAVHHEGT